MNALTTRLLAKELHQHRALMTAATAAGLAAPVETATPETTAATLMDLLSDGHQQAVPILDGDRLAGLVTRSDLIALLAARLRSGQDGKAMPQ